jgi:N-acetylmuramoyl-L-alanine amidase
VRRLASTTYRVLCVLALAACGQDAPETTSPERTASAFDDPVAQAERAREAIARGQLPAGVDGLLARLDGLAGTARGESAARAAASLLTERYRRFRAPADRLQAEARWARLGESRGAVGCDALSRLGGLRLFAGDRDGARAAWLSYGRGCPDGAARAHVQASLALLDPGSARAATEVTRPASAGVRHGMTVRRVVIDAGHGGTDPGARGPTGLRESDVTLSVARQAAELLATEHGVDVVMTRDRDVYVPLEDRAERANAARADLFVSIHCNAAERIEARGVSVYALDARSDRVARRFARRVSFEREIDPLDDGEVSGILANLQLSSQGARSWRLATGVQRSLLEELRENYREVDDMGVHVARFNVLVGTEMPAVLIELSFVSNPLEESRLRDSGYQAHLARAIARAVASGPDSGG